MFRGFLLRAGRISHLRAVDTIEQKCNLQHFRVQLPTNTAALYRCYSESTTIGEATYIGLVNETLESLGDKFSEIIEDFPQLEAADATLSDGVLTVNLGPEVGVYVINKQTPNKQIWLSSPFSGPQRFDFVPTEESNFEEGTWVYTHTGETLHQVLDREIGGEILKAELNFQGDCYLGGGNN